MKKTLFLLIIMFVTAPALAWESYGRSYESSYMTPDGNFVESHYQSNSNYSQNTNWGVRGNFNPYNYKHDPINNNKPKQNYGYNIRRSSTYHSSY